MGEYHIKGRRDFRQIGFMVQLRRSPLKLWSDRFDMQGKTENAAMRKYHSPYKQDRIRRGLARCVPVYVEVKDA